MVWSPLGGGNTLDPKDERGMRILVVLKEIAEELELENLDQVVYGWILKHPAGMLPIVGSGKIERLKSAVKALKINMSLEQWYRIYTASIGKDLP